MSVHYSISQVQNTNDSAGPALVSPDFHADMALPLPAKESRDFFNTALSQRDSRGHEDATALRKYGGASFKRIVRLGGLKKGGKVQPSRMFMLKPYYDNVGNFSSYPSDGWAELTTQGLLHAGGLGHMAQKVHVYHPSKLNGLHGSPILAIELEPATHRISDAFNENDAKFMTLNWFGKNGSGKVRIPQNVHADAAKLAAIDFLINNQDRHSGNLLFKPVMSDKGTSIGGLLAIDHGCSFQYTNGLLFSERGANEYDHLFNYLNNVPGFRIFDFPKHLNEHLLTIANWWKQKGPKVLKELHKHVRGIRDPGYAKFVETEFNKRAKALDNLVKYRTKLSGISKDRLRSPRLWSLLRVPLTGHTAHESWHA